jgi:putative transport protein
MQGFFTFLQQNPFLLLFFVVGLAVWIGRASIKGYGLGMVAGAIVVGAGLSVWASTYGVKLELNNFAKSLFYYLFMYGVGLRVGPSFINSLRGDGLKFTFLAVVASVLGLALVVMGARLFDLPTGAAGGMLAGSQTMSAAIGSAEQAVIFKINPAVLMGGVAGARSHSGPCREAAVEIQSTVPWIGFPVGYAVSGILLTVFGYFAMILAQ